MLDYRISDAAQRDIEELTGYTAERFGELALGRYLRHMESLIRTMREAEAASDEKAKGSADAKHRGPA